MLAHGRTARVRTERRHSEVNADPRTAQSGSQSQPTRIWSQLTSPRPARPMRVPARGPRARSRHHPGKARRTRAQSHRSLAYYQLRADRGGGARRRVDRRDLGGSRGPLLYQLDMHSTSSRFEAFRERENRTWGHRRRGWPFLYEHAAQPRRAVARGRRDLVGARSARMDEAAARRSRQRSARLASTTP